MNIDKFLRKKWIYSYTRRMTYQKIRLYHYGYWKGFEDVFGYKQGFELYRFINGDLFGYLVQDEVDGLAKHLLKKLTNRKFISKVIKGLPDKINRDFKKYLFFVKSLPQDWSSYSNFYLNKVLKKYYEQEKIVSIDFWILFGYVEVALTKSLEKLMEEKGISLEKIKDVLLKFSEPIKKIPLDLEKLSLLETALKEGKHQKFAIKKHWEKFAYLPMYDIDYKPYDLSYLTKRVKELNKKLTKKEILGEINNIKKKYKKRYSNYLKIIQDFKNQKELLNLLKFFAAYGYLKDYKPYIRDQGNFYIKNLFKEIAKRLNLTLEQTLFLNEKEIERLLNKKISIDKNDLNKRINNSVYLCYRNEINLITDQKIIDKIDKLLKQEEKIKEIRGLGVSAGLARGRVSIILSNNDFGRFKEGEILVASATRPDFVPLMKKAKAVITDEGGLLSHAAIVCRELHKPCIVGTIKATRILKDGDLVEVDAEQGIVRILKKSK